MSLSSGTQLGPYEVLGLLGAGAMGEVYRARDTRLRRQVALKVLPASVSEDSARLQRFRQEARAAGALNHPNILAIHDVGEDSGASYVVSELLEGQTLRERLAAGGIPLRKALEYAGQVARGLAAAHEKGIVHRDLKPENIFVTREGAVKILDFGLAKLTRQALRQLTAAEEESPTASLTGPGTVLGTVGYMSPEQVRGQPADHRSDIFSFGTIFYEMLTGRRAFRGKSAVETMNAILKEDPPELTTVDPNLPPAVERVVAHCLEKNPDERFQSARDLAFDLDALSQLSSGGARALRLRPSPWRRARPVLLALVLLGLPAAGFLAGRTTRDPAPPTFHRVTFRRGAVEGARFAPDGQIVYSAAWDGRPSELFGVRAEAPESRALGLPGAHVVSVSRTGEMGLLLSREAAGKRNGGTVLARVPLAGGPPREVLEGVSAADATPDGNAFAILRPVEGRFRLEFPIGTVLYETAAMLESVRISPRGDRVAFLEHPVRSDDRGTVGVVDLSGRHQALTGEYASVSGLAWSPDGAEVWFTAARVGADSALYAVDLKGQERLVSRAPGRLVLFDISREGRVLLQRMAARMEIKGLLAGDEGERDLSWFDYSAPAALSADGRRLLFYESGEGGGRGYGIYLRGTDGSLPVRLGEGRAMGLSSDGRWVLSIPLDPPSRLVLLPTGAGQPVVVRDPAIERYQRAWYLDDQHALVYAEAGGKPPRLYVQDLRPEGRARPVLTEGVSPAENPVSPDGFTVLGYPPDSDTPLLYPLDGGDPRPIPGLRPDDRPLQFCPGGTSLYVSSGRLKVEVVQIDLATGQRRPWRTINAADAAGLAGLGRILPAPAADGYVYSFMRSLSELYVVEGLR